jgi:pimeloyl-ACP methyl ester carboxylesterase
MTTITINHESVHIFVEGEGRQASAVFIHGAGGSHAVWEKQFSAFKELFTCYFVDLPGHGQSSGQSLSDIEDYAVWLGSLLEALELSRPILIGHSMGSAIVMQYAIQLPAPEVRALILVGSGARLRVSPVILELLAHDFEKASKMIAKNLFGSPSLDAYFQQVEKDMIVCGQKGMTSDFLACDRFDLMNHVADIRVPTLAIVGSKDIMTPPKYSRFLTEQISHSRLEVIDDVGHMVMAEQPEEFNRKLHQFYLDFLT